MTPDPSTLAANLKRLAADLGLHDCRIALLQGPAPHADAFQAWLDDGRHGSMEWMARQPQRRCDPREVLPGARSVVSLALNYWQPHPHSPPPQAATGSIARYAWGDDYHPLLDRKLRDLCSHLEDCGGTQKLYADTGPILERDWATASGLGWNGKSTLQIHPTLGCYFFLAEILTTLEIAPDRPLHDHCGKCTRCLTACPTQAITAPHQLDARRCLSYLTIEHQGPIPLEFRQALGDRIYGCDDCLAACPWNRFAQASRETAFAARPFVHQWPLRHFLALDPASFTALFRLSPIRRIKLPAFLRNVCVALGNVGTPDDLPALCRAAQDPNPLIAEHAQWALCEIARRLPSLSFPDSPNSL